MALSRLTYTGNGSTPDFGFGSIDLLPNAEVAWSTQLKVYLDGVLQTLTTDYNIDVYNQKVVFVSTPGSGVVITIARETKNDDRYVTYVDNSITDEDVLNRDSDQLFFLIQENLDNLDDCIRKDASGAFWAGQGLEVKNAAPGTTNNSLATVGQVNAAVAGVTVADAGTVTTWTNTGDGSTTAYTLTDLPAGITTKEQVHVFVSGVRQYPATYSLSGTTLTFTTAPPNGADILFQVWTGEVLASLLADNSITTDMIVDDAVTLAKLGFATGSNSRVLFVNAAGVPSLSVMTTASISDFDAGVIQSLIDESFISSFTVGNTIDFGSLRLLTTSSSTTNTALVNNSRMAAYVTSQISSLSLPSVKTGSGFSTAGGTFAGDSVGFQPNCVILTTTNSSFETYTRVFASSGRTWNGITVTFDTAGFDVTGLDPTITVDWVAIKNA